MKYYANDNIKTRKWLITILSVIFIFIFVTTYLLVLQPDLLNLDWIAAHKGVLWSGYVANQSKLDWLNNHYHLNLQASVIGTSIEVINDGKNMLSINVLWIILGAIGLVFVVLLTLKLTKQINYDSFTFVLTILFSFITFIFVDLIPHWDNEIVRTIAIIAILVAVMTAYYFLFNTIFNSIIIRSHSAYAIKNEYEMDEQEVVESTEKIKNSTKQSGEEFVEV